MSYDDWKTHNPDDDRCEFCGVSAKRYEALQSPDMTKDRKGQL